MPDPGLAMDVLPGGALGLRLLGMVAGAAGVCPGLHRVLVALDAVIVGVVFGGGAMRLGRVLVECRRAVVRLIGHDGTFCWPAGAGPTDAALIVF